jgi:outer membrane receptor protein involved in Fe transport
MSRQFATRLTLSALATSIAIAFPVQAQVLTTTNSTTNTNEKVATQSKEQSKDQNSKSNSTPVPAAQKVEIKTTKAYDERRHDTAGKMVVTQEEITKYGDTDITDVLKRLPSITVVNGVIQMRGLGTGYTQILLNGEPSPPGFSVESLAPDLIERIEIIRSASAEFSTQAIAGTLNIVTKKTVSFRQKEFKFGVTERNDQISGTNTSFQISDKVNALSYSLPLSANFNQNKVDESQSESRKYDALGNLIYWRTSRPNSRNQNRNISFAPRLNYALGDGDSLNINSFINANRNDSSNTIQTTTLSGIPFGFPLERFRTQSQGETLGTYMSWTKRLDDSAKLELRMNMNFSRSESQGNTQGGPANQAPAFDRHVNSNSKNRGLTHVGKYTFPYIEDHAISSGWEISRRIQSDRNQTRGTTSQFDGISTINLNENVDLNLGRISAYAQDEWSINKQFSTYLGLRWEQVSTRGEGSNIGVEGNAVDSRSSVVSPILQALYKLPNSNNDQIRVAFARTYKPANTWDLIHRRYYSTLNTETSPDSLANPKLKPELATGIDFSIEHFLAEGGVISANFFFRTIDGIIVQQLSQENNVWVTKPMNVGNALSRGVEFDTKFSMRNFMENAPNLDFRGNLAINRSSVSHVTGPNNRLNSQVPMSINVGVDYKFKELPLSLGSNFNYRNAGLVQISNTQSNRSSASRWLDAYAQWKFDRQTNIRLSLNNALHQTQYQQGVYRDSQGSSIRNNRTPSYSQIRLQFEHKFEL